MLLKTPKIVLGGIYDISRLPALTSALPSFINNQVRLPFTVLVSPLYTHDVSYGGAPDKPMLQFFSLPSLDSLLHHSVPDDLGVAREGMAPSIPEDLEVDASTHASSP